jgi:Nucleotidyl transferase AbiEii toxin, Type IV TA system
VTNPKAKKNLSASVRQRLLNLVREQNEDFGLFLTKYGLERILFRLSQSRHRDVFILKGALLFELWTEQTYRPTRDADFLGTGESSLERFNQIFKDISAQKVEDDGLRFDAESVKAERIKEDADYEGVRVTLMGHLDNARIPIQIDIGFGDVVTPGPRRNRVSELAGSTKSQTSDVSQRNRCCGNV